MSDVKTTSATAGSMRSHRDPKLILSIDPRTVMLTYLSVVAWISTTDSLWGTVVWACLTGMVLIVTALTILGSVSWRPLLIGALSITLFTCLFYLVFTSALAVGLLQGGRMALRLVSLIGLSTLLFLSLSPLTMAAGITRMAAPARFIGLPVANVFYFSFFLSRMAPGVLNDARHIGLAQLSRSNTSTHSIVSRVLPTFASGLRRGDTLALALTARGYDTSKTPDPVRRLRFAKLDYLWLSALAAGWIVWLFT